MSSREHVEASARRKKENPEDHFHSSARDEQHPWCIGGHSRNENGSNEMIQCSTPCLPHRDT